MIDVVRITNNAVLDQFMRRHPNAVKPIRRWRDRVIDANWNSPHDVDITFSGVRRLGNRRLIFKIKWNDFRLVADVDYEAGTLTVQFIGTHASYDEFMKR